MQHLILFGFIISAIIAPFVFANVQIDASKSLSAHIAESKRTIWFARIMILLVCSCVALWYAGWYAPTYAPSFTLTLLVLAFCALAAVVAIIPRYKHTVMGRIHDTVAYIYSLIIPFVTILMALNAHSNVTVYVLMAVTYLLWAILAAGTFRWSWRYFLYFQISFMALFGVGLLVATYVG